MLVMVNIRLVTGIKCKDTGVGHQSSVFSLVSLWQIVELSEVPAQP